jgi:hypothetical protein
MDIEILKKIDKAIEKFYPESPKIAEKFVNAFGRKSKSQVKNFENIVFSTTRFTEIINFVKNQAGKDYEGKGWAKNLDGQLLGDIILQKLTEIDSEAKKVAEGNDEIYFDARMRILRGWTEQVVTHYEYLIVKEKK